MVESYYRMKQGDNLMAIVDKYVQTGVHDAVHVLYRDDFKDESMWIALLDAHGIETSEKLGIEYDEITIRAKVESYEKW